MPIQEPTVRPCNYGENVCFLKKNPISYLGLNNWHHWLVWAAVFLWCAILGDGGCLSAARVFWLLVTVGLRWVSFNGCSPSCGLVTQRWGSLLPRGWGSVGGGPGTGMGCFSVAGEIKHLGPWCWVVNIWCVITAFIILSCFVVVIVLPLFPSLYLPHHLSSFLLLPVLPVQSHAI